MPANGNNQVVANQYAQALLDLANQAAAAEPLADELRELKTLIAADPSIGEFFRNPTISLSQRKQVLDRTFANRLSPLLRNLLGVLARHSRHSIIGDIADAYQKLLDRQLGRIDVRVTVAQPLDDAMLEQVRQRLAAVLKKTPVLHQTVDQSIIGGLVVQVEDKLLDASVKAQLQAMKAQFIAAPIKPMAM